MKSAQILDIKATVQDQINANNSLRQQIEVLRTDKINLQREIQLMEKGLEESKNSLRVSYCSLVFDTLFKLILFLVLRSSNGANEEDNRLKGPGDPSAE